MECFNYFTACILAIVLGGCAVAIPVHEAQPPQTSGKNAMRFGVFFANSPVASPDLGNTSIESSGLGSDVTWFGYKFAYGIHPKIDLEAELLVSFLSGSTYVFGAKYQYLGTPFFETKGGDTVASVKLKYIDSSGYTDSESESDSIANSDLIFYEKLEGKGFGISNQFGYLLNNWFLTSFGLNYTVFEMDAVFRDGGPDGARFTDDRTIEIYGANLGIYFIPRWTSFGLIFGIEPGIAFANEKFYGNQDSINTLAFSFLATLNPTKK